MKKKILFIINPVSGVGRHKVVEKLIDEKLDRNRFDFEIQYTKAPKHAIELASEAAQKFFDFVVAVGGDGSVNEVGQALIGSKCALGILPAGSGNGLARHLGIPMNMEKALDTIMNGKVKVIDTGLMNNKVFLGMSGAGFDAHIGWKFAQFGKRGFSSYIKVFLREYPKYEAQEFSLRIDGVDYKRKALLISVANGSQYGNNAFIAPKADVVDGLLDVCVLRAFPLIAIPLLARRLFNRTLDKSKYLEIIKGKEITILQEQTTAHLDGEPLEEGNELKFRIRPASLNVIC